MSQPHRQCASILLTDQDGKILFVRQNYGLNLYAFPGGVVDLGETPTMSAIREAMEEVSLEVEIEYQIGSYLLVGGGWPDILASVYKGKILTGTAKAEPSEISEIKWLDLNSLPSPLALDTEAALEDFAKSYRGVVRTCERKMQMPKWHAN